MNDRMPDHEQIQNEKTPPAGQGEAEPNDHEGHIQAKRQDTIPIADGAGVAGGQKSEVLQGLVEGQA